MKIDNKFYLRIGELVYMERKKQDIMQIELAQKAGVSRASIANLELGKFKTPLLKIKKVLNFLGYELKIDVVRIEEMSNEDNKS